MVPYYTRNTTFFYAKSRRQWLVHPWDESCSFNLIPVGFAAVKVCSAEPCLKAVGVMTCGKDIVNKQLGSFVLSFPYISIQNCMELFLCMLHFAVVIGRCNEAIQKQMMQPSSSHRLQGCVRIEGTIFFFKFFYKRFALHVNVGGSNVGVGSFTFFKNILWISPQPSAVEARCGI